MRLLGVLLRSSIALALSLILLALTMSASAECAWVLWLESTYQLLVADKATGDLPPQQHNWTIIQADPIHSKCGAALNEKLKGFQKPPSNNRDRVKVSGNIVFITRYPPEGYGDKPSAQETLRFLCLPDTIDPRGK